MAQTGGGLQSIENANAEDTINLNNYLGNRQNIHPKVLSFEEPWNGYLFWMAYTPYPNGATEHENPCIAVSNDMFNWTVPSGVTNPLDPVPATGFNSDTHLIYREDTGVMEIWWRWVDTASNTRTIFRRTSTDGVNWTSKEEVMRTSYGGDVISPAVIFEDGKYKIWFVNEGSSRGVYYMESIGESISQWSARTLVNIDWGDLNPWHPDVIKTDLGYELITTAYSPGNNNNSSDLYYVLIDNDGLIHKPQLILARSKNISSIDNVGIYRSSILKYKNEYYIYYSSISKNGDRNMSVSYGDSILGLNGYKDNSLKQIGSRTMNLSSGIVNGLDVKHIDFLSVGQNTTVTIERLVGGWTGKKVTLLLTSSSAKVILKNNSRLNMPFNRDFTFDSSKGFVLELVCQDAQGTYWRPIIHHLNRESLSFNTPQKITNLNVSDVDVLSLYGGTPSYTIESLTGGYAGKKMDIVLTGGISNNVIIKHSSDMLMPNNVDYHLKASEKRSMRLIWISDTRCVAVT